MQARRKIDNKKKLTDSQIAAWLGYQEKEVHIQVRNWQLSLFFNEIIVKLEWTEIHSQERTHVDSLFR